jgi:hypothetical protein
MAGLSPSGWVHARNSISGAPNVGTEPHQGVGLKSVWRASQHLN